VRSGLFGWVRSWVSALLVALAALLLAVAQRVDEEPVAWFVVEVIREAAEGLKERETQSACVWRLTERQVTVRGSTYSVITLAGDDNE
jgi:transposase-like protein